MENLIVVIDFGRDLDEIMDELFWQDMYIRLGDYIYIQDTFEGQWFGIECKYTCASLDALIAAKAVVKFNIIDDFEWTNDLEIEFN